MIIAGFRVRASGWSGLRCSSCGFPQVPSPEVMNPEPYALALKSRWMVEDPLLTCRSTRVPALKPQELRKQW